MRDGSDVVEVLLRGLEGHVARRTLGSRMRIRRSRGIVGHLSGSDVRRIASKTNP